MVKLSFLESEKFNEKMLYVHEKDPQLTFDENLPPLKENIKWGQLKLLVTEVLFLSRYWNNIKYSNPTVVYVGASPGNHIVHLSEMFPEITFECYDNRPFFKKLNNCQNVKIFNKYFEESDYSKYLDKDIFLISDIRNLDYDHTNNRESAEQMALEDMNIQKKWVLDLKPKLFSLKFRLPYDNEINTTFSTIEYLDGDLMIQPWTSPTSSELRLIGTDKIKMKTYNFKEYNSIMFYKNIHMRQLIYKNPFHATNEMIAPAIGLTNDMDTLITVFAAIDYCKLRDKTPIYKNVFPVLKQMITFANGTYTPDRLTELRKALKL